MTILFWNENCDKSSFFETDFDGEMIYISDLNAFLSINLQNIESVVLDWPEFRVADCLVVREKLHITKELLVVDYHWTRETYHLLCASNVVFREKGQIFREKNVHLLSHGSIRINQGNRSVSFFENKEIELSKNEYRVFQFLFDNRNKVISTEELINSLWDGLTSEANVYMTMQKLRNKIEKKPYAPELLLTKKNKGYVLMCH